MRPTKRTIGIVIASALLTLAPAAASPMMEREKLEKLAEVAARPAEHVAVAKQYRMQAEQFEEKAKKHEAQARKLQSAAANPMTHKWPSMAPKPAVKERELAMEARRAAKECLEASDRHMRLSVEKLAEAADSRSTRSSVD